MAQTVELDKYQLLKDLVSVVEEDQERYPEFTGITFHNTWQITNVGSMMIFEEANAQLPKVSERLRELAQGTHDYIKRTYGKTPPDVNLQGWGDMTHIVLVVERNFGRLGWTGQVVQDYATFAINGHPVKCILFQLNRTGVTPLERDLNILHEGSHILDWYLGINPKSPMPDSEVIFEKQRQALQNSVIPVILGGGDHKDVAKVVRDNLDKWVEDRIDDYMKDPLERFVAELFSEFQGIPFDIGKILIHNGFHDATVLLRGGIKGHHIKKKQAQQIYLDYVDSLFDASEWKILGRAVGRRNRVLA